MEIFIYLSHNGNFVKLQRFFNMFQLEWSYLFRTLLFNLNTYSFCFSPVKIKVSGYPIRDTALEIIQGKITTKSICYFDLLLVYL